MFIRPALCVSRSKKRQARSAGPVVTQSPVTSPASSQNQAPDKVPNNAVIPGVTTDAIFRRGFAHHARGEFSIAAAFYEWLMEIEPDTARHYHWYGVIKLETGDAQAALNFISKSITLDASDATAFLNLGNCMQALDLHEQAVQVFGAALSLREDYAQAALNMGNSLRTLGRSGESRQAYDLAIRWQPDYASAWFNLANLLSECAHETEALEAYDRALQLNPAASDVWCNRGNLLKQMLRLTEALDSYDRALALKPADATVWSNRGLTLHEMSDFERALQSFDEALRLRSGYVNALCNRGNSLRMLNRLDEALECYDKALQMDSDHAQAHCNRGLLMRQWQRTDDAMQSFDEAIRCNPDMAEAYSNRALMHKTRLDFDASMRDQIRALELNPLLADAHSNLGSLFHDLNRIDEAIASHRKAVAINPQHPEANWNLSLDLILDGQMQEGWKLYEWRLHRPGKGMSHTHHDRPRWNPAEPLHGKTVLLTHEQGFGDTLQFCRYVPLLQAKGANVMMEAPLNLHAILATLSPSLRLFEEGACNEPFDVWCPVLSLPLAFDTTVDNIPNTGAYLSANAGKSDDWNDRLQAATAADTRVRRTRRHPHPSEHPLTDALRALTVRAGNAARRMRIGLCVSGNPRHENTLNRDLPLHQLLAQLPDCHDYVLLQKRISDREKEELRNSGLTLTEWSDYLHDFSDTAALCSQMDLIISVDTSVAHLAAAIGCPTWILLPWVPDWRWLMNREDSPWYSSVRLFRQNALQDWQGPIEAVSAELEVICLEPAA